MTKKVLFIVAQNGFRDEEFFIPAEILENNDIQVTVASIKEGMCYGSLSGSIEAEIAVKDAKIKDYDCLAIAGGPGAKALKNYPEVISIIQDAEKAKKIVSAICIAPTILAEAGVRSVVPDLVSDGEAHHVLVNVFEKNGMHEDEHTRQPTACIEDLM